MQFLNFLGDARVAIVACLCMLSSQWVSADQNSSIDLRQAIQQTLISNPQLFQFSMVQESLRAQGEASNLSPPTNLEVEIENVSGAGIYQGSDAAEITMAMSSIFEMGGKRFARVAVADARLNRTELEQQAITLDILGELTATYVSCLATQYQMDLANDALSLSRSLLATVTLRADRGAAPEAEVMRAQASVAEAEIRVDALNRQFRRQKVLLAKFWGEATPAFSRLEGDLFSFGQTESFNTLASRIEQSPAMQVFASEARLKDAELKLAKTNSRNDLTWRIGVKRFEESGDSAFTAGISIPLFIKRRNSANERAAVLNRKLVDYAQQEAALMLRAKLFEAYSLYEQNRATAEKINADVIPPLEKSLALTKVAYEGGRYRYQDWVAAQEQLLNAKKLRIEAALSALLNQAVIEQLTGEHLTH